MVALTASFAGTIPEYYDRCLGPACFEPFAVELARRVDVRRDVLEIACGSGLVTRHVRARLDRSARIVATDLSAAMIDYARSKLSDVEGVEWREANAMELPFPDAAFGAVVCGFGMMFVPDKVAALKEAHRVLADGGTFHFSVWDAIEENPHALASAEVSEGLDPALRFRVPYELHDPSLLRDLVGQAGFSDVDIETKRLPVESESARTLATGAIRGTPRSLLIEQRGISLDTVVDKLAARLAEIGGAAPYRSHAQALIVRAR